MQNLHTRNKIILIIFLILSIIVINSSSAYAAPNKQKRKEKEISKLKKELEKTVDEINDLEEELITIGSKIIKTEDELKKTNKDIKTQKEDMKARIKYIYENNNEMKIAETFAKGESLGEVILGITYIQEMQNYDNEKLLEYKQTINELTTLEEILKTQQKEIENKQEKLEKKTKDLNKKIKKKKIELEEIIEIARKEKMRAMLPPCDTNKAQKIVSAAYSELGVPYVWGGTTPGRALDCSGLTQYCHKVAGISIGRTSGSQGSGGARVSNPRPGDLVCYSGHVGIYVGNGQMIHSPKPGQTVRKINVYGNPWYVRYY